MAQKVLWEESRARNGSVRNPDVYVTTDEFCDFSKLLKLSMEWRQYHVPLRALLPHLYFGHPVIILTQGSDCTLDVPCLENWNIVQILAFKCS